MSEYPNPIFLLSDIESTVVVALDNLELAVTEPARAHAGGTTTLWWELPDGRILCVTEGDGPFGPMLGVRAPWPGPQDAFQIGGFAVGIYTDEDTYIEGGGLIGEVKTCGPALRALHLLVTTQVQDQTLDLSGADVVQALLERGYYASYEYPGIVDLHMGLPASLQGREGLLGVHVSTGYTGWDYGSWGVERRLDDSSVESFGLTPAVRILVDDVDADERAILDAINDGPTFEGISEWPTVRDLDAVVDTLAQFMDLFPRLPIPTEE